MPYFRQLSGEEKISWVREARDFDRELALLGVDELKARFEELMCSLERRELAIMVLQRQLERKGCSEELLGGPRLRKSLEAMKIAFGEKTDSKA